MKINISIEISPEEILQALRNMNHEDLQKSNSSDVPFPEIKTLQILRKEDILPEANKAKVADPVEMVKHVKAELAIPATNGKEKLNYKNLICEKCGKEFAPLGPRQKYCSYECGLKKNWRKKESDIPVVKVKNNRGHGLIASKNCQYCHKEYKPSGNSQRYCSDSCNAAAKSGTPIVSEPELPEKEKHYPPKKPAVNQINFELGKSKKCANCENKFKPIAESQVCCSSACCNELLYATETSVHLSGDLDVIIDKPVDPNKSFYQQKVERERLEKEKAAFIDNFRIHPKIDHEKIKKNKQFQYQDTSL
jgi:hypothetical protein